MKTLLYINFFVKSRANSLLMSTDKTKDCQANCIKLLHCIIKAVYFVNILKVLA